MKGFIVKSQPNLMFIHFDSIDDAGHTYQWGSKEYYNALKVWKYPHFITSDTSSSLTSCMQKAHHWYFQEMVYP